MSSSSGWRSSLLEAFTTCTCSCVTLLVHGSVAGCAGEVGPYFWPRARPKTGISPSLSMRTAEAAGRVADRPATEGPGV